MNRMSRNDGGAVGLAQLEARGMRAMLAGRDAVMRESRSPSSKTDEGWGEAARGEGLGVIRIGDCPRIREMGMLAASMDRPRVAGGVVLQHGQGAGVRVGGGGKEGKRPGLWPHPFASGDGDKRHTTSRLLV